MLSRPPEPIVRTAEIDGGMRWSLTRVWDASKPLLVVIGNNPSDANAERDDPTMWVVMKLAYANGYGGVLMLNIYPFISSDMGTLRRWALSDKLECAKAMERNVLKIAEAIRGRQDVVAAWGNLPLSHDMHSFIRSLERIVVVRWCCFGITKSGAPKHPMARGKHRIPDNQRPIPWRLSNA